MNVLILSANTGEGHNSCSEAIREVFISRGDACEVCDSLAFVSKGVSRLITKFHVGIYRNMPGAFKWGYAASEKHPGVFGRKSPVYLLFRNGAKKLGKFIEEKNYDIIIACHVFAAVILTEAKKFISNYPKTAFVATDYTRSPSVDKSSLDYYFIPDESLTDEFIIGSITEEKIYSPGIPVRKSFLEYMDKSEAKMQLGIKPQSRHLLVMCGSMGCGPMAKLVRLLANLLKQNQEISVICGTNEKLKNRLSHLYAENPRIHIYGYVKNINVFMAASDLYLTKPGGISVIEAAAKRLPMVFVNAVSGCEDYNCDFFVNIKGAVTAKSVDGLARICARLLEDEEALGAMSEALEAAVCGNAAEEIYKILCE